MSGRLTTLKWNKLTCYRAQIGGEQKPFSWCDKLELFGASTAVYKVLLLVPKWKLWGIKWVIHAERLWKGLFKVTGDASYKRAWSKPVWCLFMSECWGYHVKPAILNKHPSHPARLILLNGNSCEQRSANSECKCCLVSEKENRMSEIAKEEERDKAERGGKRWLRWWVPLKGNGEKRQTLNWLWSNSPLNKSYCESPKMESASGTCVSF